MNTRKSIALFLAVALSSTCCAIEFQGGILGKWQEHCRACKSPAQAKPAPAPAPCCEAPAPEPEPACCEETVVEAPAPPPVVESVPCCESTAPVVDEAPPVVVESDPVVVESPVIVESTPVVVEPAPVDVEPIPDATTSGEYDVKVIKDEVVYPANVPYNENVIAETDVREEPTPATGEDSVPDVSTDFAPAAKN